MFTEIGPARVRAVLAASRLDGVVLVSEGVLILRLLLPDGEGEVEAHLRVRSGGDNFLDVPLVYDLDTEPRRT